MKTELENTNKPAIAVDTVLAAGHPLTRDETKAALLEGYKIGHKYFEPTEYIYCFNYMTIFTEEGFRIDADIFWNDRSGEQWEKGWFIYGEQ